MLTKLNLFVFLLLTTSFSSIAQEQLINNLPYKTSKPYKVFDFDHNFYVTKNKEIVVIKFIRSHCVIQRFNTATPELIKENRFSDFFPSGFRIETFKEIGGNFYFFYSLKSKNSEEVFVQEIDFDKAEFISQPKLIFKSEGELEIIKESNYLFKNKTAIKSSYEFIQPKDKSTLLIKYITYLKGNNTSSIKISLFNKILENIYLKTLNYEVDDKKSFILSSLVDNNGNFYFASKTNLKDEKTDVVYKICLNTVKYNSNEIKSEELNLENKFINELWIRDFEDNIVCTGFTSDFDTSKKAMFSLKKTVLNNSNGIAVFKLNLEGEIIKNFKINIPDRIINFYNNQKSVNYFENAYMHDFEVIENGDIVIIGEQYSSEGNGNAYWESYRDILICKLNDNGELNFIKRLPKLQIANNESQPFSFKTFYTDNYIYIPFIDNVENLDSTNVKIKNSSGDLILSKISLKDGGISRKFILNIGHNRNNLNKFSINRFYKSNLNSFCFDAYKKDKEDVIINVDFND